MLGLIKRNFSFKNEDVVLPLSNSFFRLHFEYAVEFWSPPHEKDIAKLEGVQCRAIKMIPSLQNKPCEKRLSHLNLFSPEKWSQRGKLVKCFTGLVFPCSLNVAVTKLFMMDVLSRMRSNRAKLMFKQIFLHQCCSLDGHTPG